MAKALVYGGKIPQLLTFPNAAHELGILTEKLEEIARLGLAPYYHIAYGQKRIKQSDLPKWQAALEHYDGLWGRRRRNNSTSTAGYVYFVQCEHGKGPIKIGSAQNVEKRLAGLQSASPYLLKLLAVEPGGEKQEFERHAEFRFWRLHGEWFREDCPELKRAIREVKKTWGQPRKNRVPKKISDFVESQLCQIEEAV